MSKVTLSPGEVQAMNQRLESIEKLLKNKALVTEENVLTTEQVMNYLSVSRRCLQGWRDNSLIEYSAINNKFYYYMSSIHKMLDKHLVKSEF